MGIFSKIKRKTEMKALFCGLDNSGKSTIISFLQEGKFVEHTPTMGKAKKDFEVQGTKIALFDMGGQTHFRKMWLGELSKDTNCVVYVLDRSDAKRFNESKEELMKMIPIIKEKKMKLLVFANKSDISTAAPIDVIYEKFNLQTLDNFEILQISAKTGFGMADAFIKFYSALTGKQLKKNVVASAISIYDKGGIPLVIKTGDQNEINDDILQGGFLSAITNFANMKMGNASVKFESDNGEGTFIIKSSANFIGALLWNSKLNVSIDESEESLNELLEHLEQTIKREGIKNDGIAYYVSQYCTNMM